MADSNHFKRPGETGFLANDPFAELTRLTGAPASDGQDDDFPEIDLEREMLGDFDFTPPDAAQARVAAHWGAEADETPEPFEPVTLDETEPLADFDLEAALDEALAFDDPAFMDESPTAAHEAPPAARWEPAPAYAAWNAAQAGGEMPMPEERMPAEAFDPAAGDEDVHFDFGDFDLTADPDAPAAYDSAFAPMEDEAAAAGELHPVAFEEPLAMAAHESDADGWPTAQASDAWDAPQTAEGLPDPSADAHAGDEDVDFVFADFDLTADPEEAPTAHAAAPDPVAFEEPPVAEAHEPDADAWAAPRTVEDDGLPDLSDRSHASDEDVRFDLTTDLEEAPAAYDAWADTSVPDASPAPESAEPAAPTESGEGQAAAYDDEFAGEQHADEPASDIEETGSEQAVDPLDVAGLEAAGFELAGAANPGDASLHDDAFDSDTPGDLPIEDEFVLDLRGLKNDPAAPWHENDPAEAAAPPQFDISGLDPDGPVSAVPPAAEAPASFAPHDAVSSGVESSAEPVFGDPRETKDLLDDVDSWFETAGLDDEQPASGTSAPETAPAISDELAGAGTVASGDAVPVAPATLWRRATPQAPAPAPSLEDELNALLSGEALFAAEPQSPPAEAVTPAIPQADAGPQAGDLATEDEVDALAFDEEFEFDDFDLDVAEAESAPQAQAGDVRLDMNSEAAAGPSLSRDEPEAAPPAASEPAPRRSGPLSMLAALAPAVARFGTTDRTASARPMSVPAATAAERAERSQRDAPQVETVEFDEQPVALADDLAIPDLVFEPEDPTPAAIDDLESELDEAFGSLALDEPVAPQPQAAPQDVHGVAAAPEGVWDDPAAGYGPGETGRQEDYGDFDFDYDFGVEEDPEADLAPVLREAPRRKRRFFLFGAVAAVALMGGISYVVFGPASGGGEPVLVRADTEPVRVRPENRGGTTVPNQDSLAYQRAAGTADTPATAQERLITTTEEPIDLSTALPSQTPILAPDELPMVGNDEIGMLAAIKSDERMSPFDDAPVIEGGTDVVGVAPRRVRTMMVRADGTLVPREEAPDVPAAALDGPAGDPVPAEETSALPGDPVMPETVALVPSARPSERPAAAAPAPAQPQQAAAPAATATVPPATPAASEWSMQIASQPNAESAQATYQDLARRYGGVLEGKGVNIVRAEIDGMGTVYRVRIPAQTREEAVQLCTTYQSAGGSCFVSR